VNIANKCLNPSFTVTPFYPRHHGPMAVMRHRYFTGMSVFLFDCLFACLFVHVDCGHGLLLLCQHCNRYVFSVLGMTSCFHIMDLVMSFMYF